MDIDVPTNSKKRMPSSSPDGNDYLSCSDDSYDWAVDTLAQDKVKADWRVYQLRRNKKSPENYFVIKLNIHLPALPLT